MRILNGKIFKITDHDWRFVFERNLVEFGENEMITLDEDTAYLSKLIGNIHENQDLIKK